MFGFELEIAVNIASLHELAQAQLKTIASRATNPHKQTTCKCGENEFQQSQEYA